MESLRDLFVFIGIDADWAGFQAAAKTVEALQKGLEKLVEVAEEIPEFFKEAIEKTAEFGEHMELLSIKTGASSEEIQKLGYAATLNGSSAEAMGSALQRLARMMEQAKDGSAEAQKHFSKLGISMEMVRAQSPTELFKTIADKLKGLNDAGKASASAMQIFGRSGKDLVPTLLEGKEGLEEMGEELDALGGVMSNESVHAAHEFEDGLKKIHAVSEGLVHMIGSALIEAFQPNQKAMLEWVKANREVIKTKLLEWMGMFKRALALTREGVSLLVKYINNLIAAMKIGLIIYGAYILATGALAAINAIAAAGFVALIAELALTASWYFALGVQAVAAGLASAAAWLAAAAPVVLLTAAIVIAALAADDFKTFLEGGDSVLGLLLNKSGELFRIWMQDPKNAPLMNGLKMVLTLVTQISEVIAMMDPTGLFGRALDMAGKFGTDAAANARGERGSEDEMHAKLAEAMSHMGGGGAAIPSMAGSSSSSVSSSRTTSVVNAPLTVIVPPGTPTPLVKAALKETFHEHFNAHVRDTGAHTGGT